MAVGATNTATYMLVPVMTCIGDLENTYRILNSAETFAVIFISVIK